MGLFLHFSCTLAISMFLYVPRFVSAEDYGFMFFAFGPCLSWNVDRHELFTQAASARRPSQITDSSGGRGRLRTREFNMFDMFQLVAMWLQKSNHA